MSERKRDLGLDCLRITCMLLIVLRHSIGHGNVDSALMPGESNWYIENVLFVITTQSVNCLVLISGYFLCTSKFRLNKLLNVWGEMLFYSVGIYLLLVFLPGTGVEFSIMEFIKCCMVFTMDRYWFMTDYLLLYMTFPFLNCAIKAMNKKMHFICCCVLIVIFSILPNIVYVSDFSGVNGGYSYTWFVALYFLAAYFRLYVSKRVKYQKMMLPIFLILSLVICGERFVAYYITPLLFGTVLLESLFYSYSSMVSLPCALTMFQFFRGLNIKSTFLRKGIQFFSPLTFAVYLIHEQPLFRPILWEWLNPARIADSVWMVSYLLACTLGIFTICCLIEFVRKKLFEKIGITKIVKMQCDCVQSKIVAWLEQS